MGRELLEDESGQVSAELIIVMAAILAVAMIFVKSLSDTVTKANNEMGNKSADVLKKIHDMT